MSKVLRGRLLGVGLGLGLLTLASSGVHAAGYDFSFPEALSQLDAREVKAKVGVIGELRIGDVTLQPDIEVRDAGAPGGRRKVVAVLKEWTWNGGVADPISMTSFVSQRNRAALAAALAQGSDNAAVSFSYVIRDCSSACFVVAESSGPASASLQRDGDQLSISVSEEAEGPGMHELKFAVSASARTTLTFADAPGRKVAKKWGVTVARH